MEYIVKQQSVIQTVVTTANGVINTKVAEEMLLATGLVLNMSKYQRCLFDLTNTEFDPNQTMTDIILFVQIFTKAGIGKTVRMASIYVNNREQHLHLERAVNLENFNLKQFTDRGEALKWLCK